MFFTLSFSYQHVHLKHTDIFQDKQIHKHKLVIHYSPRQQLDSKLSGTRVSQVTPPPNHPVSSCTSNHISQIQKVHIFTSKSVLKQYSHARRCL